MKSLWNQYKIAKPNEKKPLRELRDIIRDGEENKRQRKGRLFFLTDPYALTKKILGENEEVTWAEIDLFLQNTLKDLNRHRQLTENTILIRPDALTGFYFKVLAWEEIQEVIKFSNYSDRITRAYKSKGREVNKASKVADQDNKKPSSFVGKERKRKEVYRNKGRGWITQHWYTKTTITICISETNKQLSHYKEFSSKEKKLTNTILITLHKFRCA